jgi:(4S)-4-hydroxy-5-phosphonooxypentane-2,3-dione isomerase
MDKISLVVELKLKPGRCDAFVDRARRHGEACLDTEPGCLQFDVLVPTDASDRVFLYEVYADQTALDAHGATAHMAAYRSDTNDMILERIRTTCALVSG